MITGNLGSPTWSWLIGGTALLCLATLTTADADKPAGGALAGERPRVIISSDIGGDDPDDFQSMAHLLIYADVLDIEGLIASPPGAGRVANIREALAAYRRDYPQLRRASRRYPSPDALDDLAKQGASKSRPAPGYGKPTEGSEWIIRRAKARERRPLYVLVWGGMSDVAQALHDAPEITKQIRVYSIGSWNTDMDPAARDYVFRSHPKLWWIEANTTFRGMYIGGRQEGDLGNRAFLSRHVRGHGALGDFLVAKKADIKMGDTPTLLYLLRGNPDDPTGSHWGGAFIRPDSKRPYWTDDRRAELREGDKAGAKTVNRWRTDYLRDWQRRMEHLTSGG